MNGKKKQEEVNPSDLGSALPAMPGLSSEEREDLVNAVMVQLKSVAGPNWDVPESLSPEVRGNVEVLRAILGEQVQPDGESFEERAALEAERRKLYAPSNNKGFYSDGVAGILTMNCKKKQGEINVSDLGFALPLSLGSARRRGGTL